MDTPAAAVAGPRREKAATTLRSAAARQDRPSRTPPTPLPRGHGLTALEPVLHALRRHGAEVLGLAHQRQLRVRVAGEPVEQLDELHLIVEVVLEPEHDLVVLRGRAEQRVALPEIGVDLAELAPSRLGDEAGALARQRLERQVAPDWSLVQDVAPRQDRLPETGLLQCAAGMVTVRYMQHS
jgi:hypothetical protein